MSDYIDDLLEMDVLYIDADNNYCMKKSDFEKYLAWAKVDNRIKKFEEYNSL